MESDNYLFISASNSLELGSESSPVESIKIQAEEMISIQTFDQQEPITILKDLAGIKSQEVRFEKIEMSLLDMLNAAELEEIYVDLLVADMYEKQKNVYALGTRPSTQVGQKRVDPEDSFRKQVKNDPDSTKKARERASQLEESTLRMIYQKNSVKESQGERSKEEKQAEKERYIQSYNQYSDFMNRAKQENSQRNSSIEVHSAGAESNSKAEVNSILSDLLGNAQDFLEKSGLDLLLISQKPEYLSKKEDTSKLYSRFTYFEKVIGPQIFGAELGILIGAVAIVASVFTGGTSLVLLSFAAGGVVLGAADVAVNAQKLNDLYNGDYYTDPKFLGMNQDVLNVLGLLVGAGEIGAYGLKGLFKSGDYASLARNMDELAELDDLLRNANRYDQNEIRARIEAAIAQNRATKAASNIDLYLKKEKELLEFNNTKKTDLTPPKDLPTANTSPNGAGEFDDFAQEPFLPDEYYKSNYAPMQGTPGARIDFSRLGSSGQIEKSRVIYDQAGKQKYRIDYTDHGNSAHHTNPHMHEYIYQDAGKSVKTEIKYFLDPSTGRLRQGVIDEETNSIIFID